MRNRRRPTPAMTSCCCRVWTPSPTRSPRLPPPQAHAISLQIRPEFFARRKTSPPLPPAPPYKLFTTTRTRSGLNPSNNAITFSEIIPSTSGRRRENDEGTIHCYCCSPTTRLVSSLLHPHSSIRHKNHPSREQLPSRLLQQAESRKSAGAEELARSLRLRGEGHIGEFLGGVRMRVGSTPRQP